MRFKTESSRANEHEMRTNFSEQQGLLRELVPVYQKAYAGLPWFEVSKCACPRGYSAQKVGEYCAGCGVLLTTEAYPAEELFESLKQRIEGRPSTVYVERVDGQPVLGAVFYLADTKTILRKYAGRATPGALSTIRDVLPTSVAWLDEIFADTTVRASRNLQNFGELCRTSARSIGQKCIAFRTINERLLAKAQKTFGDACTSYQVADTGSITGSSYLVIISLPEI